MKNFAYATALSPASARELVAHNGAYLAGGNDLLGLLKEYLVSADTLVNIKSLPGLNKIERGENFWTIGALVTVAQIEHDADIKKTFPGLHEAASDVASQQIPLIPGVNQFGPQEGEIGQRRLATIFTQTGKVSTHEINAVDLDGDGYADVPFLFAIQGETQGQ